MCCRAKGGSARLEGKKVHVTELGGQAAMAVKAVLAVSDHNVFVRHLCPGCKKERILILSKSIKLFQTLKGSELLSTGHRPVRWLRWQAIASKTS